jgi:phosphoenolpyruvate synthase/pyruvate phosphate dikinase
VYVIPLDEASDRVRVGGKAWVLARLRRSGIPVPYGFCVPPGTLEDLSASVISEELEKNLESASTAGVAVRSSAVAEDGRHASFAGIYTSELNVPATVPAVLASLARIAQSATSERAISYGKMIGRPEGSAMAALVQEMVYADAAGVMFTANPITGEKQYVIESSWGLGESVASGRVVPDRYTIGSNAEEIHIEIGRKDRMLVATDSGVDEVPVPEAAVMRPSIGDAVIRELMVIGAACDEIFGSPQDVEWAVAKDTLWVTQCRPISTL